MTLSRTFIAALVPIVLSITQPAEHAHAQAPAPQVTVAQPLAKSVTRWDEFSGRFEAVDNVDVRPRVSGFVEKVHFEDGQIVAAGDLLFSIDKRPFEIEVAVAAAAIARAKAQVGLQENEVERARPLARSRTLSRRDLQQREANLDIARAELASAEATLRSARLNLEWADVRAPIGGRVSNNKVGVGALVTGGSSQATILTTIVSLDPIHFVFDASEADFLRYVRLFQSGKRPSSRDAGNPVRIKLSDEEGWPHTGRMDFVDNQLNPRSGTIRGRAILKNGDQILTPGLFGRMQLFGGEFDALLVPDSAIVSDQARKIVFVVDANNKVGARPVTLGPLDAGLRVVQSGLQPDDRVVINGIANPAVRPGATVNPIAGDITTAKSN
ncbi:MAG: efflux RND transporter periplasmic adaptor subunit [Pseudomonadota bacterium]